MPYLSRLSYSQKQSIVSEIKKLLDAVAVTPEKEEKVTLAMEIIELLCTQDGCSLLYYHSKLRNTAKNKFKEFLSETEYPSLVQHSVWIIEMINALDTMKKMEAE